MSDNWIVANLENAAAADRSEITGEQANWDLVLAVFATKVAGVEDDTVEDVVIITSNSIFGFAARLSCY